MRSEARERVLVAAEQLFAEKGYGPVTLREIGAKAGLNHSSLYHHVPGGKEDLFVEVMERIYARHDAGVSAALTSAAPQLRAQLYAVADWLLSQPPIDREPPFFANETNQKVGRVVTLARARI